jgi:enoyl-[acyl-carrier protein] reductase/trans-2-enoyl-CoA reductase (NAD+)
MSDFEGYQRNFLNLFGFEMPDVDYDEDVDVDLELPSTQ